MPKKLSIQDIQHYIDENDINHECKLISTEYVNSVTPLLFLCTNCGEFFSRDWAHLKRRRFSCPKCASAKQERTCITIQDVLEFIQLNDVNNECTLLSTNYINATTPLKLKCNICNEIFERDFAHIKRNRFRCPKCGMTSGAKKLVYSEKDVDDAISKRGYTRVGEYINANTPFEALCKRGHKITIRFSHFLNNHSGCRECANLDKTGENSPNWRGGASEVIDHLRKSIFDWKQKVLKRDGYCCQITGEHQDLIVHHIIGFDSLLKKASEVCGVPVLHKIADYNRIEDYYLLQDTLQKLHLIENGITLTKRVHEEFHNKYGRGNNDRKQFEEFLLNYK